MLSFAYKSQTNKPSVLTMSLFSVFGCFDIWELADTGGTGLWGQPVPRESEQLTWEQTTHLGVCLSNADQPDLSPPPAPSPSPHTPAAGHLPASLSSDAGQLGRPRSLPKLLGTAVPTPACPASPSPSCRNPTKGSSFSPSGHCPHLTLALPRDDEPSVPSAWAQNKLSRDCRSASVCLRIPHGGRSRGP